MAARTERGREQRRGFGCGIRVKTQASTQCLEPQRSRECEHGWMLGKSRWCWRLQGSSQSDRQQFYGTLCLRVRSRFTRKLSGKELARPAATLALSGTRVLWVRVARMSTSDHVAVFPGTCPEDVAPGLPKQARERGGRRQAAVSHRDVQRGTDREPCLQNDAGNMFAWYAMRYTFDAGHRVQDGVLDVPTAGHTCSPVKCAVPTLANTDIVMHKTSTSCLRLRRGD